MDARRRTVTPDILRACIVPKPFRNCQWPKSWSTKKHHQHYHHHQHRFHVPGKSNIEHWKKREIVSQPLNKTRKQQQQKTTPQVIRALSWYNVVNAINAIKCSKFHHEYNPTPHQHRGHVRVQWLWRKGSKHAMSPSMSPPRTPHRPGLRSE